MTFSQSATGFTASDVTVTGGTLSGFNGSGTTYTFNVTPAANGTIAVNVPANGAVDVNNTGNSAATQFSITYSQPVTAAPVVIMPANGNLTSTATPTYAGTAPATSTVTVYIDGTTIGTTTATAGGNWALPQPTALDQGSHSVRATAQLSGQAVSANSNTNTFTVDTVSPTASISSTASNPTSTSPIPVTVTFSEAVTGFVAADVTVSNGTLSGFSGSGTSYTFLVTPSANGAVTVNVATNVAQDAASNGNTAAPPYSINYSMPNQPPVINPQSFTVNENALNSTVVGTVVATDPDQSQPLSYSITAGNTAGAFMIGSSTGQLTVASPVALDYETTPTFPLTVQVSDGALTRSATITVSLNDVNEGPFISTQPVAGSSVCAGSTITTSVTVSGTEPFSYQWYKNNLSTLVANQTTATLSLTDVQVSDAGSYSVVVTSAGGSVTSTPFVLSVNPLPVAALTNNGPLFCFKASVTLTASGGGSYRFSSGATQVGSGPTATVSSAGVYSVTVVSGNGCSSVASTTVVGDQSVPPTIVSQSQSVTTVCGTGTRVGFQVMPGGTGPYTLMFFRDNTQIDRAVVGEGTTVNFSTIIQQSGSYQIVVTNACNQAITTFIPVTVTPLPTVYNVTGGGAYCTGGTGIVVGLSGSQTGVNYQLLRNGTAVGSPLEGTGSTISFGNQTLAGTYTVQATITATSCQQTMSSSVSVTVNPQPTQYAVTGGGSFCAGAAGVGVGLAGSQTGVNYQLLRGGNNVGNSVAGTGSTLSFGNQTAVGTYTVLATSAGTACQQTMTGSAAVTVNSTPVVSVTNPAPVCSPAPVNLNTAVSSDIPASFAFFTNADLTTPVANPGAVAASGTYYVRATSGAGCVSEAKAISVQINTLPVISITGLGSAYCKSVPAVTLTGTPTGGSFTVDDTAATRFNPANLMVGNRTVSYQYTDGNGCANTATQVVIIKAVPMAPTLLTQIGQAYPGGQASVTVDVNSATVNLIVSGCNGGTINWTGPSNTSGSGTTINVPTNGPGTFAYMATCTTNGCTSPAAQATVSVGVRLTVLHRDVDNYANNNSVQPVLIVATQGGGVLPLSAITLRYYLTVENFMPLTNLFINYAQVGAANVKSRYVPLEAPRQGTFGYVEYSFTAGAGQVAAGKDSGPIQGYIAKSDYGGLNELDDYSYATVRDRLLANPRITAYYNGTLVWGQEPALVTPRRQLQVLTESKNGPSATAITTNLDLRNEGNLPVDFSQLRIRYYFTADNQQQLAFYSDFRYEGALRGQLVKISPPLANADTYLEITPTFTGQLMPLSNPGVIRYSIYSPQGARFDQTNDYSYQERPAEFSPNNRVVVYVGSERVWGQEPGAAARIAQAEPVNELNVTVLGNPVRGDVVSVQVKGAGAEPLQLQVVSARGRVIARQQVASPQAVEQHDLSLGGQGPGVYLLQVSTPTQSRTIRVLKTE